MRFLILLVAAGFAALAHGKPEADREGPPPLPPRPGPVADREPGTTGRRPSGGSSRKHYRRAIDDVLGHLEVLARDLDGQNYKRGFNDYDIYAREADAEFDEFDYY